MRQTVTPYGTLAPLYDTVLGDRFFLSLRRSFEGLVRRYGVCFGSAADVACGTGTFVRYLRQRRVPVVFGVDRSSEMLRVAIRKNLDNGARFLLQDFATLQFPQPVDLITCHFDSLNYLLSTEELLQALGRFHANLNPGGHLIFDMVTERPPWKGLQPRVEQISGPGVVVQRLTRWDSKSRILITCMSISRNGRTHWEVHMQRGYPVAVIISLLSRARFSLLGVHDFHTLSPSTLWTRRAVYVALRK